MGILRETRATSQKKLVWHEYEPNFQKLDGFRTARKFCVWEKVLNQKKKILFSRTKSRTSRVHSREKGPIENPSVKSQKSVPSFMAVPNVQTYSSY